MKSSEYTWLTQTVATLLKAAVHISVILMIIIAFVSHTIICWCCHCCIMFPLWGDYVLILADRLEVKCGQGPLREVPRESCWWPHKLWPNRALLAPLRNTASHCARLKKRISRWEKGFPLWNPLGQQAKLCLIIQSLLCRPAQPLPTFPRLLSFPSSVSSIR